MPRYTRSPEQISRTEALLAARARTGLNLSTVAGPEEFSKLVIVEYTKRSSVVHEITDYLDYPEMMAFLNAL